MVDVDYGGSTGYGRAYQQRLAGRWGIVDVDDRAAAARHLAARGDVDPARLAIRGRQRRRLHHPVHPHLRDDFRGRGQLLRRGRRDRSGPRHPQVRVALPGPPDRPLARGRGPGRERSPIHFTDRLSCPVILLQGWRTRSCPGPGRDDGRRPRHQGHPVRLPGPFPGEQHGFRQASHIRRALEAELYFYSRVFGFDLPTRSIRSPSPTCRLAILGDLPTKTEGLTASVRATNADPGQGAGPREPLDGQPPRNPDELLKLIEAAFESTVFVRGNEITITGEQVDAERVARLFEELITLPSGATPSPPTPSAAPSTSSATATTAPPAPRWSSSATRS